MEILVMTVIAKMKNTLHGNYGRLDVAEQKIGKLEDIVVEFQIEARRKT